MWRHHKDTSNGFIPSFFLDKIVHVSRPPEQKALNEIVVEQGYLVLTGRLGRIIDHIYSVMASGVVEQGSDPWRHLESISEEIHGGQVYRRRRVVGGGRG